MGVVGRLAPVAPRRDLVVCPHTVDLWAELNRVVPVALQNPSGPLGQKGLRVVPHMVGPDPRAYSRLLHLLDVGEEIIPTELMQAQIYGWLTKGFDTRPLRTSRA